MIRAIQDLSIIIRPTLKICTALLLPQIFSKSQDIAEIIIINQLCCFFRSISIPFYLLDINVIHDRSTISIEFHPRKLCTARTASFAPDIETVCI